MEGLQLGAVLGAEGQVPGFWEGLEAVDEGGERGGRAGAEEGLEEEEADFAVGVEHLYFVWCWVLGVFVCGWTQA